MNLNVTVQEYAYGSDCEVPQQTCTAISHVIASLLSNNWNGAVRSGRCVQLLVFIHQK